MASKFEIISFYHRNHHPEAEISGGSGPDYLYRRPDPEYHPDSEYHPDPKYHPDPEYHPRYNSEDSYEYHDKGHEVDKHFDEKNQYDIKGYRQPIKVQLSLLLFTFYCFGLLTLTNSREPPSRPGIW